MKNEASESGFEICVICVARLDGINETSCQMCGGKFHYPWSSDSNAATCGQFASHNDALAIVFLCNDCIENRL